MLSIGKILGLLVNKFSDLGLCKKVSLWATFCLYSNIQRYEGGGLCMTFAKTIWGLLVTVPRNRGLVGKVGT